MIRDKHVYIKLLNLCEIHSGQVGRSRMHSCSFMNHNEVISIKMHSHVCHSDCDPDTIRYGINTKRGRPELQTIGGP